MNKIKAQKLFDTINKSIESGSSVGSAIKKAGITRATYYMWKNKRFKVNPTRTRQGVETPKVTRLPGDVVLLIGSPALVVDALNQLR